MQGLALDLQDPAPVGQLDRLGDDAPGAEPAAHVAAADLGATLNQHNAETGVARQAVAQELPIARLEDMQRHGGVREEDGRQREHRQARPGHPPPWHDRSGPQRPPPADGAATREGPASRPALTRSDALLVVLRSSCAQSVAPACGAVGAGAALSAGRHTHRRERGHLHTPDFTPSGLLGAPPKPTSVTHPQPGGSASSVEPVDCIGSSFPLGATAGAPVAARCFQYPPRPPPCEPHANWAFAKSLVGCASVTRTSHRCDLTPASGPGVATTRSPTLWPWHCRHPRRTRPRSSPARRRASGRRSPASWRGGATG